MLAGTANGSAYGGSPASAEATPVCSVIGAICTPRLTSSVTSAVVNGRPALGISADPMPSGECPGDAAGPENTVWYADSG